MSDFVGKWLIEYVKLAEKIEEKDKELAYSFLKEIVRSYGMQMCGVKLPKYNKIISKGLDIAYDSPDWLIEEMNKERSK